MAGNELPHIHVIERAQLSAGAWLEIYEPGQRYNASAIRKEWETIRGILDQSKIATDSTVSFSSRISPGGIELVLNSPSVQKSVPVLISTTYFPSWQRDDREAIYPATPFFMLTFVRQSIHLRFERRWMDWLGLWISAGTLLLVCGTAILSLSLDLRRRKRTDSISTG
ncbi:MAG: hypothetical protein M3X11_15850, partial [Acidobacteriota bacterium]|nr:hypothetical protein [Acidobacteriota bacterium]